MAHMIVVKCTTDDTDGALTVEALADTIRNIAPFMVDNVEVIVTHDDDETQEV